MAQQDQALAAVQERADLLGREAEDDRQAAATEASRTLEAARAEAAALVGSAKEHAERIRRDSERELAAATARRDSITAQLSNVRNMLATLGGGAAVGLPAEDEHPALETEAAPEAAPVEEVAKVQEESEEAVDAPTEEVTEGDATDEVEAVEGDEPAEVVEETDKKSKAHARR